MIYEIYHHARMRYDELEFCYIFPPHRTQRYLSLCMMMGI